jgi:hypothetical protein
MSQPDKTRADRLTLISEIAHLDLGGPVLVRAGESYWFDWDTRSLVVEDQEGRSRSFPASWPGGPDARR